MSGVRLAQRLVTLTKALNIMAGWLVTVRGEEQDEADRQRHALVARAIYLAKGGDGYDG